MEYTLECTKCGEKYGSSYPHQTCAKCNGLLEVFYRGNAKAKGTSFWDYENMLPKGRYAHYELGGTRLIRSNDNDGLFLKLEIENPTRSFKDRGSVIEVGKAKEYGHDEVVCASTGNMAYSIAYYAKLLGLRVKVFISSDANKDKIEDIRKTHDADITQIDGDFTKAQAVAERYAKKRDAFLAGDYCYRKEGQKTVTFEVMSKSPDATHIIVPVGNATLISGMFKALREMQIKEMPKIIGVQSERCMPLVRSFNTHNAIKYERPKTRADAIAVGFPTFGEQALEGIRATGGRAVSVSDSELEKEKKAFYKEYGLIAELAGVAGIVAARKLKLGKNDKAIAIISGGNI